MALVANHRVLRGGFQLWDGRWYIAIARHGYWATSTIHDQVKTPWPFFPVLPIAMRVVSFTGISVPLAGILVNHLAFLLGLAALHRIARRHGSPRSARLATWVSAQPVRVRVLHDLSVGDLLRRVGVGVRARRGRTRPRRRHGRRGRRAHSTRRIPRDHRADVRRPTSARARTARRRTGRGRTRTLALVQPAANGRCAAVLQRQGRLA